MRIIWLRWPARWVEGAIAVPSTRRSLLASLFLKPRVSIALPSTLKTLVCSQVGTAAVVIQSRKIMTKVARVAVETSECCTCFMIAESCLYIDRQ